MFLSCNIFFRFQKSSKNTNFSNENPGPGYYDVENTLNKNFQGIGYELFLSIILSNC